jgi:DNA polymerase/3'-5' exonuclease PolX
MEIINPTNEDIADVLNRIADLLEAQDANRYRVLAYRRGAQVIADSNQQAAELALEGEGRKLEDLPDIGPGIAGTVREYVHTIPPGPTSWIKPGTGWSYISSAAARKHNARW